MSFFQSLFSSSQSGARESVAGPETGPVKMNLDERMAFRREMLFDSVKSTMESRGILSASYRFKVVRADKRGHSFVVMVDLSTDFMDGEQGQQRPLMALGDAIRKNALTRYGIGVPAVYWRVNEEIKGLIRGGAKTPSPAQPRRRPSARPTCAATSAPLPRNWRPSRLPGKRAASCRLATAPTPPISRHWAVTARTASVTAAPTAAATAANPPCA